MPETFTFEEASAPAETFTFEEATKSSEAPILPELPERPEPFEEESISERPSMFRGAALPINIEEIGKRIRLSDVGRKLFGPTEVERQAQSELGTGQPSPYDVLSQSAMYALGGGLLKGIPAGVVGGKMVYDQILALPDQFSSLKEAIRLGDPVTARKAGVELGLSSAMLAAIPLAAKFGGEINKPKTEVENASQVTSPESVLEHEVRPQVGEETSLRQPGEVARPPEEPARGPQPVRAEETTEVVPPPEPVPQKPVESEASKAQLGYQAINESLNRGDRNVPDETVKDFLSYQEAWSEWMQRLVKANSDERLAIELEGIDRFGSDAGVPQAGWDKSAKRNLKWNRETGKFDKPVEPTVPSEPVPTVPEPSPKSKESAPGAAPPESSVGEPPPVAPLETVGMGGAKPEEIPPQGNPDITGIAQRVREQTAAAGQERLSPIGEGISAADSVTEGESILQNDPAAADKAMAAFEADPAKAVSAEAVAAGRAKLRRLAFEARRIEEKFGTDSPEFRAAFEARSAWADRMKKMQTEWHKSGMAQQGEQDIDTGSFTGLASAFRDATGQDFTPQQAKVAKVRAGKVKEAEGKSEAANTELNEAIDREAGGTSAEKRALAAASKTVRENAIRVAEAENESRVAATEREKQTAKIQEDAARKALKESQDREREAAIKLSKAENEARVKQADRKALDDQAKAAQKALDAASETVREAAARLAKAENRKRTAKARAERKAAEDERRKAKAKLDEANRAKRQAAIAAAKAEVKNRVNPELRVLEKIRDYIEKGETSFDEIRTKVATDLGMTSKKVMELLGKNKQIKRLADEAWRNQKTLRRFQQQARLWLRETQLPGYRKALEAIPRFLFNLKVGFHGTVALGTHAPMVAFQPRFWATYIKDFAKMYRLVGRPTPKGQSRASAYYEMQVQDLLRRKNYMTARRAGLVNDPFQYEEYQTGEVAGRLSTIAPRVADFFNNASDMGNRGYSILKILRQDMFDQMWDKLPQTTKTPQVAEAIADGINHATGVVKAVAPKGTATVFFAPKLEMSRVSWLLGDPIRAANTFANWKNASQAEKFFAVQQVKEKAWVAGVAYGLLAINQGLLSAADSKQKINFTDPFSSDFLKFKIAGMDVSYGNAMLSMARLPLRLWVGIKNEGKLNKIVYEDENTARTLFSYARSQASPFMGLLLDLALGRNFQERPLPRAGFGLLPGKTNVPKRLKATGEGKPFTWPEYWSQTLSPIPFQEALREVWKTGLGMSEEQMVELAQALATIGFTAGTGGRITEDWRVAEHKP